MTVANVRGPIRRPEYTVSITVDGTVERYRVEAGNLDRLADVIESNVRALTGNRDHVGIALDPDGTVWIRYGFTPSINAGTWQRADEEDAK